MIHNLRELFRLTGSVSRFILLLILRSPFDALRTILQAYFLQFSFRAIEHRNLEDLYIACIIFSIVSFFLFVYNGSIWMAYAKLTIQITSKLKKRMFEHISSISFLEIESKSSGEWYTRLNSDVKLASAIISQPLQLPHAVVALISIGVSGIVIFRMNTVLFVLVLLFTIPHILITQIILSRSLSSLTVKAQELMAKNTTGMNSLITCADTAVLYDAKNFLFKHYRESSKAVRKINMKMKMKTAFSDALQPIVGLGGFLMILLIGGEMISRGELLFDKLIALLQYRISIVTGTAMLTSCILSMKSSIGGARRVLETMNIESEE